MQAASAGTAALVHAAVVRTLNFFDEFIRSWTPPHKYDTYNLTRYEGRIPFQTCGVPQSNGVHADPSHFCGVTEY
jgi:hypothetical protein